jgi:hypothetical protein
MRLLAAIEEEVPDKGLAILRHFLHGFWRKLSRLCKPFQRSLSGYRIFSRMADFRSTKELPLTVVDRL